jgi:hypothetical protein
LLGWTDDAVASELHVLNKLSGPRRRGEDLSDTIIRLAAAEHD